MHVWPLQSLDNGIRSLVIEVMDSSKLLCGDGNRTQGPLEEQCALLTTDPFLQSHIIFFLFKNVDLPSCM